MTAAAGRGGAGAGVKRSRPIVAIDGPAGAGKTTVSKALAERLGFTRVDTGAIYRTVALAAIRRGIALDDDAKLGALVNEIDVAFAYRDGATRVILTNADGSKDDVSEEIRTADMSLAASRVSARQPVRAGLLGLQRRLAGDGGAVLDGRDIGTVVFPDAEVKFFLTASLDTRARRRYLELKAREEIVPLDRIKKEIEKRDRDDSSRALAPLKQAEDAVVIDTSDLSPDQVVERMMAVVDERWKSS
jgi:cytidylate kinase